MKTTLILTALLLAPLVALHAAENSTRKPNVLIINSCFPIRSGGD